MQWAAGSWFQVSWADPKWIRGDGAPVPPVKVNFPDESGAWFEAERERVPNLGRRKKVRLRVVPARSAGVLDLNVISAPVDPDSLAATVRQPELRLRKIAGNVFELVKEDPAEDDIFDLIMMGEL
jgi:hypothetical protein